MSIPSIEEMRNQIFTTCELDDMPASEVRRLWNLQKPARDQIERVQNARLAQQAKPVKCDEEEIAKVAQAAFHASCLNLRGSSPCLPWEQEDDSWRQAWRRAAKAVFAAYQASQTGGKSSGD